jgi:choline dehydrogenase
MAPVHIAQEGLPGSERASDPEILKTIQNMMSTVYLACCTCNMRLESDHMAIFGSRPRVFGVTGLRVVGTSAFPILTPEYPQSIIC